MRVTVSQFAALIQEQKAVFDDLALLLAELAEAAKAKDGVRVTELTPKLLEKQEIASTFDEKIRALALEGASERGIPVEEFRLSLLDLEGRYRELVDASRMSASAVARLAAQVGGILSANVHVIEDTIKVLESIDARASSYGPDRSPATRPTASKLFDHSA